MHLSIPLKQMSVEEKLQAIEEIWADLASTPANIPSPAWHADVLQVREERIAEGRAQFLDIEEAKKAVRERLG
ncbi:MAG TPA: addiction module antitoxin RelB [Chlorobaculum sp.]|jgi:hypothetical protein|uniref:Addiction module component n=1 Tax=Chlorobaculum tepidum (strain ATCC 49652 / DSM 12025 / NBRC 103806 / TLS) TaxID=194439 RepID=Q8KEU9_CHLTE|nr:addiction module protein [Chlorobaculum tepidum]AAM71825.1 hypothetical protein CT0583 [Chlorobaculum tepidum TLS]HBU24064.1 addiction module antitoxin RelB [Chlorobaculum sp.]